MKKFLCVGLLLFSCTFSTNLFSTASGSSASNRPLPMQEAWFEYEAHQNEDGTYEIHCTGPGFYCKTLVF